MARLILGVILFSAVGIFCILRRRQVAEGFGLAMGARFPAGCMVVIGVGFILMAVAFIVLYQQGMVS